MIQHLLDYTKKEMKPEMGPWAEEYTVKMDKIQTKLKWNKNKRHKNKLVITDYQAIYETYLPHQKHQLGQKEMLLRELNRKGTVFGCNGKNILVEGEQGIGRSVLCKKITWDWAKGKFATFSLVFFVSLKIVGPGDVLENVIIDQYRFRNVDRDRAIQTVSHVLEKVGDRCLIILDGLDEHPQGFNSEFLTTVMGGKYSHVNFLLTSIPGFKIPSSISFQTIATIESPINSVFNEIESNLELPSNLRKFETKNLVHPRLLGSQVQMNDDNPMLRTFLYVLAANKAIDLNQGQVSLGKMFTKLLIRIYKSYKLLDHVAKIIGKLAFKQLQNEEFLFKELPAELLVNKPL